MIKGEKDSIVTISQNPRDGIGKIVGKQLLTEVDMGNNLNGLYINYLDIGAEIGYHEHHNEDEVYYILEGTGIANDNGAKIEISTGSVLYTKMGSGHGLKNIGSIPLKFLAFMVKH
jgi:mannose-6-phosphate isomerase-like protein (cupin superfamily)